MGEPAESVKLDSTSIEGLEELLVSAVDLPGVDTGSLAGPGWSLSEAAEALEVNERTVRRWIKQRRISAWKVDGPRGPEWRVQPGSTPDIQPVQSPPTVGNQGGNAADNLAEVILDLSAKLTTANEQLTAASFRIGYLEAQAEAHKEQVKLLTDSQHKHGRWSRFWSWFTGR